MYNVIHVDIIKKHFLGSPLLLKIMIYIKFDVILYGMLINWCFGYQYNISVPENEIGINNNNTRKVCAKLQLL